MPGMWELPPLSGQQDGKALLSLRHSITVTDYSVRVLEISCPDERAGNWIAGSRLSVASPHRASPRKILRKVEML